jgi:hypothetical protein
MKDDYIPLVDLGVDSRESTKWQTRGYNLSCPPDQNQPCQTARNPHRRQLLATARRIDGGRRDSKPRGLESTKWWQDRGYDLSHAAWPPDQSRLRYVAGNLTCWPFSHRFWRLHHPPTAVDSSRVDEMSEGRNCLKEAGPESGAGIQNETHSTA